MTRGLSLPNSVISPYSVRLLPGAMSTDWLALPARVLMLPDTLREAVAICSTEITPIASLRSPPVTVSRASLGAAHRRHGQRIHQGPGNIRGTRGIRRSRKTGEKDSCHFSAWSAWSAVKRSGAFHSACPPPAVAAAPRQVFVVEFVSSLGSGIAGLGCFPATAALWPSRAPRRGSAANLPE